MDQTAVANASPPEAADIILDLKYEEEEEIRQKQKKKKQSTNLLELYDQLNQWMIMQSPIKFEEKLLFFQLLVTINNAGVSIPEALSLIAPQTKNLHLQFILKDLQKKMNNGLSLADSIRTHPNIFDPTTAAIIDAGEQSGKLGPLLKELVKQQERINKMRKKTKSVMTYPVVVISVMILLVIVVLTVIVPKLEGLFGGSDQLPLPTRMLINGSDFVMTKWYLLVAGALAIFVAFKVWTSKPAGREQLSVVMLKVPVINTFIKQMVLARITRILGFLISSGVSIMQSLKIAANVAENPVYKKRILLAADDLSKGIEISENFSDDESLFPNMLVQMLSIGEKTSSMGNIMTKVADYYDEELDRGVDTLSKLMEPIILIFLAIGAVFMILAIYLPILKLNETLT